MPRRTEGQGAMQMSRLSPDSYDPFSLPQKNTSEPKDYDVFTESRKARELVDDDVFALSD